MADQRHSKSNNGIELCMREQEGEELEQPEGEPVSLEAQTQLGYRGTQVSLVVPFTSQLSVAIIVTLSFVSSDFCKSCS